MHLQLLHEDDALLVFDKPAGLLAVPGRGADKQDSLAWRAQQRWPDAMVVHRLDMATSGLMLMARGAQPQRRLSLAFEQREVHKRYVAVVDGLMRAQPDALNGWDAIDLPIAVDWPNRPLRIISAELGKPSVTRWRVIAHDDAARSTRLELEPVTGRSHQLRVHLKALGHTILGDALYADARVLAGATRLLLHATTLGLTHPVSGQPMTFESRAPF
ncbi:RluA family pseudouridine synthase [soil metagenome]